MSNLKTLFLIVGMLISTGAAVSVGAQEVSIPDPGLNAAVRAALQKPTGPLTAQDLLSLTTLNAGSRSITNLQGLDAAHNLASLDLRSNHLSNLVFPSVSVCCHWAAWGLCGAQLHRPLALDRVGFRDQHAWGD